MVLPHVLLTAVDWESRLSGHAETQIKSKAAAVPCISGPTNLSIYSISLLPLSFSSADKSEKVKRGPAARPLLCPPLTVQLGDVLAFCSLTSFPFATAVQDVLATTWGWPGRDHGAVESSAALKGLLRLCSCLRGFAPGPTLLVAKKNMLKKPHKRPAHGCPAIGGS